MRVSDPILPTSIEIISADLPINERCGVIPVVRPQVEKAEWLRKRFERK